MRKYWCMQKIRGIQWKMAEIWSYCDIEHPQTDDFYTSTLPPHPSPLHIHHPSTFTTQKLRIESFLNIGACKKSELYNEKWLRYDDTVILMTPRLTISPHPPSLQIYPQSTSTIPPHPPPSHPHPKTYDRMKYWCMQKNQSYTEKNGWDKIILWYRAPPDWPPFHI